MKKVNVRALAAGLAASVAMTCLAGVSALAAPQAVGEAAQAVMPTRVEAIEAVERANDQWITANRNHGRSFWDNAAYHVGNMEAYFTTGIDVYRNYSEAWSIKNNWKGATSNNKSAWKGGASTGGYGEGQDWVLFGDWQICFQTYIDLYNDEIMQSQGKTKDDNKVARAIEVMSYQMSTGKTDWWWWADSLFMAMPIMSKMYVLTGDLEYLDKQYEWFKWAAETVDGGTKDGMWDTEEQLFHRDGKYIYPDHKTDNGKKDFWARGSGWVFAGLARVLSDMPTNYEHRDYFLDKYTQMAQGVARNQQPEGFWSRSILDRAHADGFESSGTSFFTYGLAWGINSGYLDRETYLDTALKGWYFLYNTALQSDGVVGYVQPIGENSKQSLNIGGRNTANFGVGAFLLAGCEISKLAGGVDGDKTDNQDLYPYLLRKLVGKYVIEVNTAHMFEGGVIHHHDEKNHNMQTYRSGETVMIPLCTIQNYMGNTVAENGNNVTITRSVKRGNSNVTHTVVLTKGSADYTVDGAPMKLPTAVENKDGYTCAPVRQVMEGLGYEIWYSPYSGTSRYVANNPMDALIVISEKVDPFFGCDANAVELLRWMLEVNHHYPTRPAQTARSYTVDKPVAPQSTSRTAPTGTKVNLSAGMLNAPTDEAPNPPANAVDGNTGTFWAAKKGSNMIIDLGSATVVSGVGVRMRSYDDGRVVYYGISTSADGSNYTSYFSGNCTEGGGAMEYTTTAANARYIRIETNGNSVSDWASVAEIEVYTGGSVNPALGKPQGGTASTAPTSKISLNGGMVKASAEPEAANPGRNAVDGNASTVWAAQGSANLVIDLGSAQTIGSVGVQMKNYAADGNGGRSVNYGISVSADGGSYTSVFNGSAAAGGGVMEVKPVGQSARYVKIDVNGSNEGEWASLAEVEVYTGGGAATGAGPAVMSSISSSPVGNLEKLKVAGSAIIVSENAPASNAIDGSFSTSWKGNANHSLVVEMNRERTITTVGVLMSGDETQDYTISVSPDGSNWTPVYAGTSVSGEMAYHPCEAKGKYVMITLSAEGRVAEVQVYGAE